MIGTPSSELRPPLRSHSAMNGHLVGIVDARAVRLALQQQRLDCGELVERVLLVRREAHLTLGEHAHVHQHLQRAAVELGAGDRDRGRTERGTRLLGRHLERLHEVVGSRDGAGQRRQGRQAPHRGPGRVEGLAGARFTMYLHRRPRRVAEWASRPLLGRLARIFGAIRTLFPLSP